MSTPVEDEQRDDIEYGTPLWDTLEAERLDYRLTLLCLREQLSRIPDGVQWLELVMAGETVRKAARALGKTPEWLAAVHETCRQVLLGRGEEGG